ncbi:MAG: response regulator [Symploca sp. SIO2E9]|nr:response regulator [Symploca sp. SIO2E9]
MTLKLTILIVEDEKFHRDDIYNKMCNLAEKVEHQELQLLTASNLDEAIDLIEHHPIDAIILDYKLAENPQDKNSSVKYASEIIEQLSEYSHRSLYILLRSQYNEQYFYEFRDNIRNLGFGFDFCGKKEDSFELYTKYNSIVDWVKEKPLPYPLAYLLHLIEVASDSEKILKMLNFVEISIRYLTAILFADIAYRKIGSIEQKIDFGNYTLGGWLRALKILVKLNKEVNKNLFVPEIKDFFFNETIEYFDYFLCLRNQYGHSLNTYEPSFRASLADKIRPRFNQFKDRLCFLSRYPLLIIENTQIDEDKRNLWLKYHENLNEYTPWYKYDTNSLMSSTIPSNRNSFASQVNLFENKVYLANWKNEFLSLHPFISFQHPSPEFTSREFFMIDSVKSETNEKTGAKTKIISYRSVFSNKTFTNSKDINEFLRLLSIVNSKVI